MKKKEYDDGEIDKDKLLRNKIHIDCVSHFIIFPQFDIYQIKCLKLASIENDRQKFVEDWTRKKV